MNNDLRNWTADLGDGRYKNPILYADYSDPDVIRVGGDYYMTASSFTYVPGLPILHSKDLVNWEPINYAAYELTDEYDKPRHGCGVWAPSIRYHDGKYWIFYGDPDLGVFMTNTEDIYGKWSPLKLIWKGKGIIDTTPLWDDDGRAYLVHAFAGSRCGFNSRLAVCEMEPDGTGMIGLDCCVYMGGEENHTIEGPKFYKKDGYYYIMAPAGGVVQGWQVCLRSKNVYGPYEIKTVMRQGDAIFNGPHQGGWVDTPAGEDWFINFQDLGAYGRVIHLNPVKWIDGWPAMGEDVDDDYCGNPVEIYKKPDLPAQPILHIPTSDDFKADKLGLQWQWQANFDESWYSLANEEGRLRLYAIKTDGADGEYILNRPNVLTQMWRSPVMRITMKVDLSSEKESGAALAITGNDYCYIALKNDGTLLQVKGTSELCENVEENVVASENIGVSSVWLRIDVCGEFNSPKARANYSYSKDGKTFEPFGEEFEPTQGKWVGAKTAIFAFGDEGGYADVSEFCVD